MKICRSREDKKRREEKKEKERKIEKKMRSRQMLGDSDTERGTNRKTERNGGLERQKIINKRE